MTVLPVPQFAIGQKVWASDTYSEQRQYVSCPDCLGTGRWSVTSPAGYTCHVECPRCYGNCQLSQRCYVKSVRELTIGSIQIDTAPDHGQDPVAYMAVETGVGSGAVYRESRLFANKEGAEQQAAVDEAEGNRRLDEQQPDRVQWRTFSRHHLRDVEIATAKEHMRKSRYAYTSLLNRICELDTYLVAGEPFDSSCPLTTEQRNAIQEALVWLDPEATQCLIQHRKENPT